MGERDIELIVNDGKDTKDTKDKNDKKNDNESFAFIQLTDDEYGTLRNKCLESLSSSHGRVAFSLIINRQRNTEYGLELQKEQFLGLVEYINLFFDSIQKSEPLDIKPAKLVMIMSQSLYVKKESVYDILTKKEQQQFEESKNNEENKKSGHSKEASNKLFIVDRIKNHLIWKNDKFWKEAYCDSVQQEILKYPAVKKWHSEQEQQEAERREEQIIFSQLAAWTHNMKEFGTEDRKILNFLDSRGLKQEQVAVLKATLQLNEIQKNNDDQKSNNNELDTTTNGKNVSTFGIETTTSSPTSSTGLP